MDVQPLRLEIFFASALERDVLGGEVAVERSGANYPTFVYRPTGTGPRAADHDQFRRWCRSLRQWRCICAHYVKPGDTLIIEEPESHLHPSMQAEFALHLVRLVPRRHSRDRHDP